MTLLSPTANMLPPTFHHTPSAFTKAAPLRAHQQSSIPCPFLGLVPLLRQPWLIFPCTLTPPLWISETPVPSLVPVFGTATIRAQGPPLWLCAHPPFWTSPTASPPLRGGSSATQLITATNQNASGKPTSPLSSVVCSCSGWPCCKSLPGSTDHSPGLRLDSPLLSVSSPRADSSY